MTSGPANIEAEQAVLGACLLSREALAAVAGFLEPAHFAEELHRHIFSAMRERLAEGALATLVTLGPLLSGLDLPEGAAAPAYLARLAAAAPSIVNAPDYARQIVDLARRRAIMRVARGVLDAAASPAIGGPTPGHRRRGDRRPQRNRRGGGRAAPAAFGRERRAIFRARRKISGGINGFASGHDRLS